MEFRGMKKWLQSPCCFPPKVVRRELLRWNVPARRQNKNALGFGVLDHFQADAVQSLAF